MLWSLFGQRGKSGKGSCGRLRTRRRYSLCVAFCIELIRGERMAGKVLRERILAIGLLMLSGCDAAHGSRDDLNPLASPHQPSFGVASATAPSAWPPARTAKPSGTAQPGNNKPATSDPPGGESNETRLLLVGKSESELREMLGSPNYEEDRPPGKLWRYQDGSCTLDIHLFPDVQTHQFGTLSYEVLSHDNSDEGKRRCTAQLKSRTVAARQ
jgi:hypothetical protein